MKGGITKDARQYLLSRLLPAVSLAIIVLELFSWVTPNIPHFGPLCPVSAHAAGSESITRTLQAPATSSAAFRDGCVDSAHAGFNFGGDVTMNVVNSKGATCSTGVNNCSRLLIWFDVTSLPGGSTISAASVDLNATAGSVSRTHGLHKITTSWTEGTQTGANCTGGGMTWNAPNCTDAWTTVGGDFNATASQTLTTGTTTGVKTFADVAALRTNVSGWVDSSSTNLGWLVKDENELNNGSQETWTYGAKENTTSTNRPKLSVTFTAVWDSYNNSARTVQDDTFSEGENTVFMRGTGYNLGGSYVVGYYDGIGDKRCTESVPATAGTLDSSCRFLGGAAPGAWTAIAFEPGITAPATLSAVSSDTHKVVGRDTFTVQSGAVVPEIPSTVAAAIVGAATLATFWWFTRSRPRHA